MREDKFFECAKTTSLRLHIAFAPTSAAVPQIVVVRGFIERFLVTS